MLLWPKHYPIVQKRQIPMLPIPAERYIIFREVLIQPDILDIRRFCACNPPVFRHMYSWLRLRIHGQLPFRARVIVRDGDVGKKILVILHRSVL